MGRICETTISKGENQIRNFDIYNMKNIMSYTDFVAEKQKLKDKGQGKSSETESGKKVDGEYLTAKTKKERDLMKKEIEKHSDKDDDDESAYGKWPADYKGGDTSGETHTTKPSPATIAYKKKYKKNENELNEDDRIEKALRTKEKESGIPYNILKQVHSRGMAAWKTGHRPGVTQAQWAMGRVNSFITGEGKAREADQDLWDEYKDKNKLT